MQFIKKYWIYLLVILVVFSIFVSFILVVFFNKPVPAVDNIRPIIFSDNSIRLKPGDFVNPEEKIKIQQSYLVGQLTKDLPYLGNNIDLFYSLDTDSFTINIKNKETADIELNDYLKAHQISDKSWLGKIQVVYSGE